MIKIWKLTIVETKEHLKTDDKLVHEVYFDNEASLERYLDRLRETRKSMAGIGVSLKDIYYTLEELPMIQASTENVYNKRNRVKVEYPIDYEEILDRFEKLEA